MAHKEGTVSHKAMKLLISFVHNGAPPPWSRADDFRAGGATRLTQRPLIIVEGHSSRNFKPRARRSMEKQVSTE
jgi:hypothetical protein